MSKLKFCLQKFNFRFLSSLLIFGFFSSHNLHNFINQYFPSETLVNTAKRAHELIFMHTRTYRVNYLPIHNCQHANLPIISIFCSERQADRHNHAAPT